MLKNFYSQNSPFFKKIIDFLIFDDYNNIIIEDESTEIISKINEESNVDGADNHIIDQYQENFIG